jgi:para-nitrobenzyl esterase
MDQRIGATVEIAQGKLRGSAGTGVDAFLGIPFAAAPVGDARFAPPGPAPAWTGVRDATAYGPEAPQSDNMLGSFMGESGLEQSEDCLSLNIWRPAGGADGLPVMVFIHGGGFIIGAAGHPCYDGSALARRGVVAVTIQYRLGVLGLLWHPCLDGDGPAGNWAMQDQTAALRWVHENIAAFGGDPDNVTIFGESAGGMSVGVHCISPASRPYFRRAIVQSAGIMPVTREPHRAAAETVARTLGIGADAAAFRAASVADILRAQDAWAAMVGAGRPAPRPMVDGELIPDWPTGMAGRGATKDLDILVTYNRDEATLFAHRMPAEQVPGDDGALTRLAEASGLPGELPAAYRAARQARGEAADPLSVWIAMLTDRLIRVPALEFLAGHAANGGNGYAACITYASDLPMDGLDRRPFGATHTVELAPLFGTQEASDRLRAVSGGARAVGIGNLLQDVWTSFARTGAPGTGATGDWPAVTAGAMPTMLLDDDATPAGDPWGEERAAMRAALLERGELR